MKIKTSNELFERFVSAKPDSFPELEQAFRQGGYSAFNELLEGLREKLMTADEERMEELKALIAKGQAVVPDPGAISPSWERIWEDFSCYAAVKEEALQAVKPHDRDGEWQVVMDNPFTNDGIACYPGMSFVEAAYLYAYFRKDLKKAEYLRLQKVMTLILAEGS